MSIFEINLPIKPISVNEAWNVRGFRKFKSAKYNAYQKEVFKVLENIEWPFKDDQALHAIIHTYFSNRASDLDNALKPLFDTLSTHYGWNDNKIYSIIDTKNIVEKGKEGTHVTIYAGPMPEVQQQ